MNSSGYQAEISRLKAANEELKKQKKETETVPIVKTSSYSYDYFFTLPKKGTNPKDNYQKKFRQ